MLDPAPDGIEYIEIYNRGSFPINLKEIYIGLLNSQQSYSYLQAISQKDVAIYPNEYWVICTNKNKLMEKHKEVTDQIIEMNLPSLNNTTAK